MTGNSALILALVCGLIAVATASGPAAGFFPRTRATPACRKLRGHPGRRGRLPGRQYKTIAIVGVVLAVLIGVFLDGRPPSAS
jgi:K(+)-stimulated pyrophosphate-energized sodium pump